MQNIVGLFDSTATNNQTLCLPPHQSCPIKFLEPFLIRWTVHLSKLSHLILLFKIKIWAVVNYCPSCNNVFLKTNLWCSKSFNFNLQSIFQLRQIVGLLKWECHFTIFQCINWNNVWGSIIKQIFSKKWPLIKQDLD